MNYKQVLKQFGLTDKETEIYLACLQLGNDTVLNIANKAEIKRPTTYNILEDLIEKGLISRSKQNNKNIYIAENPDKLNKLAQINKNNIEAIIPDLNAIYNVPRGTSKPTIKVYEGLNAVKSVYLEIMDSIKGKDLMRLYGSMSDVEENFKDITHFWAEKNQYKNYHINDLLNPDLSENQKFINSIKSIDNPNYKIRSLPQEYKFNNIDNIIYKNTIAIISVKKDITATVIENEDIANAYKTMFDIVWNISKEIK
ncbi:MAG: helix-turn-helix domain-containing protein [Patescibacteria group bacterium]